MRTPTQLVAGAVRRARRLLGQGDATPAAGPQWSVAPEGSAPVVAVCHPEWFGIRAATHAQGLPVLESGDLGRDHVAAVTELLAAGCRVVVVNGYPPGTDTFAAAAAAAGIAVRVIMHSSMAQHGFEAVEADIIAVLCRMRAAGMVDAIGFAKEGQAEAFTALGCDSVWVPPRIARPAPVEPVDLGPGLHVGIFGAATWRKNVTTQLGAAAILGATAHVTTRPAAAYLDGAPIVAHGLVARERIVALIGSVDLNLAVSLYECFPVLPQESFGLGVPCLLSRTSPLFRSDPELWELVTVAEHDNARAVAEAASRLLAAAGDDGVVARAMAWMDAWNDATAEQWESFIAVPARA